MACKVLFTLLGPTLGGAQMGIVRFMVEIAVYKWLLLVLGEIIY